MPVILDRDNYDLWLDPGMTNIEALSVHCLDTNKTIWVLSLASTAIASEPYFARTLGTWRFGSY